MKFTNNKIQGVSGNNTVGFDWKKLGKKILDPIGLTKKTDRPMWQKVLDPLDVYGVAKKAFDANIKAVKDWAEKVKKDPAKWILTPPLPRTGNKDLDNKVLAEIEKIKANYIDLPLTAPISAITKPLLQDKEEKKEQIATATQKITSQEAENKLKDLEKYAEISRNLLEQVKEETAIFKSCPKDFDKLSETEIDKKTYLLCKRKQEEKKIQPKEPVMSFAEMKARGLAGLKVKNIKKVNLSGLKVKNIKKVNY